MRTTFMIAFALTFLGAAQTARAEIRSAHDMQKECRVALDVFRKKAEASFQNTLFAGECIGYVQGAVDATVGLADDIKWEKLCVPDSVSTLDLIQKFIDFVDRNPKYTLASTAIQLMLAQQYGCPNK